MKEEKVICKWENGVTKEIEVNCKTAEIIAIAVVKTYCNENKIKYPKFEIVQKRSDKSGKN